MQPTLCARCHKNMAVVFINRIENGQSHQEGLCLKCARELHISLDAIAHAGTSRPNSVSADVLEFFSGKDDTESRDYIDLCRQVEKMKKKKDQ